MLKYRTATQSILQQKHVTIGIIVYRIILDLAYIITIVPSWTYAGFTNDFELSRYLFSWLMTIITIPFIKKIYRITLVSKIIVIMLYVVAYIPLLSYYVFVETGRRFIFLNCLYWWSFFAFYFFLSNVQFIKLKKPSDRLCKGIFFAMYVWYTAVAIFCWVYYAKFRIIVNIFDIYGFRTEAAGYSLSSILLYSFSACRTVYIIYILYWIHTKKNLLAIFSSIVQCIIFFYDGSKSALFTLMFGVGCYIFFRREKLSMITWTACAICFASITEKIFFNGSILGNHLVHRIFYLPQRLHYYYFDFFSMNEYDYFRQSFLRRLWLTSPYSEKIPNIIGKIAWGNSFANNGLFSDAYSNLGFIGLILMPFVIVLTLRVLDILTSKVSERLIIGYILVLSINLISSSYFTILLTHGLIAAMVVLYFMPKSSIIK